MDGIYFVTRYIPFWAIPTIIICLEFAYIYWLKSRKKIVFIFMSSASFSFLSLVFYYMSGGPEKSVQIIMRFIRSF